MEHLPGFVNTLAPIIHKHGYLGVGALVFLEDFGVPVPGETILITAAVFAGLGQLNIFLVAITAFIAAILGDNIGFCIGKYGGHPLVERIGKYIFLTPARIKKTEDFFRRKGGWLVIIARFIEGLRQANGIIAGLAEMRWHLFLLYNAIGAALWVGLWASVGYFGGSHLNTFLHYDLYFSILAVILIASYLTYKFKIKPKKQLTSDT
jgi:membrane protein DedA with SNARE-associated domain